jgi:hypothetical protein
MRKMLKKIAIYVEGQTEHVFLNQLIKLWWFFSNIRIDNIKLVNDKKNPVPNYISGEYNYHFVIINVEGSGHLNSTIARRANKQVEDGFDVIGLRDLDYVNRDNIQQLQQNFKIALRALGCNSFEKIDLHFAVITIEAWLLAFTGAVSKWADIPEDRVLDILKKGNPLELEAVRSPASLLALIGKKRGRDPKSYHEINSLISKIDREMIEEVKNSSKVPSFSLFWDKLTSMCEGGFV